jgi:PEGA domain
MIRYFVASALVLNLSISLVAQQAAQTPVPPAATPQPKAAQPPDGDDNTLDDGTPVKLRLTQELSSATARPGQQIPFEVVDDIELNGVTVLHRGTIVDGVVTEADAKKRMGRAGSLNFSIGSVLLADNEKAILRAVRQSSGGSHVAGMVDLMVNLPLVAAPFFLLMHGEDAVFPKGTVITAYIDGDMRLDLAKFSVPSAALAPSGPPALPVPAQASLTIESVPAGADIEIDGAFVGNAPSTVTVAPGDHQITVKKKGFNTWTKTLNVAAGATQIDAELEQTPVQ